MIKRFIVITRLIDVSHAKDGTEVHAHYRSVLLCFPGRNRRAMWAIKKGMREWTRTSCVRFKERKSERAFAYFVPGSG